MEKELKGVYPATRKDQSIYYRASMTWQRKHISLGSYDTATKAHQAYLEGTKIMEDFSITINSYESTNILDFEKWVILVNYRDNGIYFSTPIYARPKFFYYYLSPTDVLKFDIDDLFYYSSHKIMRRKGHLFVADYGMQTTVLSRLGIRSYSVPGKDFLFINQDETDFRSANIQIINPYLGVTKIVRKGKSRYQAKINVPGYYVIGTYSTLEEAAIAYNKAIDILKKKGVKKNYSPNYVDNLSPALYADIYAKCKISSKILNYNPTA